MELGARSVRLVPDTQATTVGHPADVTGWDLEHVVAHSKPKHWPRFPPGARRYGAEAGAWARVGGLGAEAGRFPRARLDPDPETDEYAP